MLSHDGACSSAFRQWRDSLYHQCLACQGTSWLIPPSVWGPARDGTFTQWYSETSGAVVVSPLIYHRVKAPSHSGPQTGPGWCINTSPRPTTYILPRDSFFTKINHSFIHYAMDLFLFLQQYFFIQVFVSGKCSSGKFSSSQQCCDCKLKVPTHK